MTKPRQNSSIWSCVRRRRNGKCRRANGARRKPSSPSCSKTGSSWHDGQPAPHTRFLIVPRASHQGCTEGSADRRLLLRSDQVAQMRLSGHPLRQKPKQILLAGLELSPAQSTPEKLVDQPHAIGGGN